MFRILLFFFILFKILIYAKDGCENKGNEPFIHKIKCIDDFKLLKGAPLSKKYNNVSSVKLVYEFSTQKSFYLNSTFYKLHYEFCTHQWAGIYSSLGDFNRIEYSSDTSRKFGLATINYYSDNQEYTLEFFADDEITISRLIEMYNSVKNTTYFGAKIKVLINSNLMIKRVKELTTAKVSFIYPDDIYKNQTYQIMNTGTAYGYLKVIDSKTFKSAQIQPNDIVISQGLPNELPLCRGIVTSTFQTPLCHINVLSNNRNTPNAAFKKILSDTSVLKLENKLVKLEITQKGINFTATDINTAQQEWEKLSHKMNVALEADLSVTGLIDAHKLRFQDLKIVGGKASNFGELTRIRVWKKPLPLPEGAFAIPFYYYHEHVSKLGIQSQIDSLLKNEPETVVELEKKLKNIRQQIKSQAVNPALIKLIKDKIKKNGKWEHYRFRSSTNAEDVPGFNGAGLYTSKTGSITDTAKTIEKALKAVWASLWNLRAYQERSFFNIDHSKTYMGILCHRSFGTETANGVVITQNIYRQNMPGLVINIQKGEHSVVLPEHDSIQCEQIVITMPIGTDDNLNKIGIDHITFSSFKKQKTLITKAELVQLVRYCRAIKSHFYLKKHPTYNYAEFENFAVDIEFKLDAKTRMLYIKQAREY